MTASEFNTLGIVTDIHGNWDAFKVVLQELDKQEVDRIVCLGDIIGYGAAPKECVQAIMDRGISSILGNHERYLLDITPMSGFIRPSTQHVIEWTREQLAIEQMDFLRGLEDQQRISEQVLDVHGSPLDPDEYILSGFALLANMGHLMTQWPEVNYCFFGHTHVPLIASYQMVESDFAETRTVQLTEGDTYMINPGSVGQPRDGVSHASYGIFNIESREMTINRIEYDISAAQDRILSAGLEPMFAERLAKGQ